MFLLKCGSWKVTKATQTMSLETQPKQSKLATTVLRSENDGLAE